MPDLTLALAHEVMARGRAAAEQAGMNAVFAVLDKGANMVAFSRMDGALIGGLGVSGGSPEQDAAIARTAMTQ